MSRALSSTYLGHVCILGPRKTSFLSLLHLLYEAQKKVVQSVSANQLLSYVHFDGAFSVSTILLW